MAKPKQKIHPGMFKKGDVATEEHSRKSINRHLYKGRLLPEEAAKLTDDEKRQIVWRRLDDLERKRMDKQKLSTYGENPPAVRVEQKLQGDDNAKIVDTATNFLFLPPIETDEDLYDRTRYYFEYCGEHGFKPTIVGWLTALGISRSTLDAWEKRQTFATSGRSDFIKRVRMALEFILEANAMEGKINPVLYIYSSKVHFLYNDKAGETQVEEIDWDDSMTPTEIKNRIQKSIPHYEILEEPQEKSE